MVLRKKIKKINIMEKNIMNTKKEIRAFLFEYSAKDRINFKSCKRKIYLTDKDYVKVRLMSKFGLFMIALHLDNSKNSVFNECGLTCDCDSIWRRFRKSFRSYIAEQEESNCDAKYLAKLKELYCLL